MRGTKLFEGRRNAFGGEATVSGTVRDTSDHEYSLVLQQHPQLLHGQALLGVGLAVGQSRAAPFGQGARSPAPAAR